MSTHDLNPKRAKFLKELARLMRRYQVDDLLTIYVFADQYCNSILHSPDEGPDPVLIHLSAAIDSWLREKEMEQVN